MYSKLVWYVLYNSYFPNNHKKLFNKCKKLEKKGVLKLIKYKDFIKNTEQMFEITQQLDNFTDIITKGREEEILDMDLDIALKKMTKAPKKYLTSVISIWYYPLWNKFTRVDVGEPELKYLIRCEKREKYIKKLLREDWRKKKNEKM